MEEVGLEPGVQKDGVKVVNDRKTTVGLYVSFSLCLYVSVCLSYRVAQKTGPSYLIANILKTP